MLTFEQMLWRLIIAILIGMLIGLERETVGKDAGVRTALLVSAGSAIFAMTSITLPYIVATSPQNLLDVIARNSGFLAMAANIVVGVGFLGAGIIIKTGEHVRGLTTSAVVWATAALGMMVGVGLIGFAAAAAILITGLLYTLRKLRLYEFVRPGQKIHKNGNSN